jgi:hypothetical protein
MLNIDSERHIKKAHDDAKNAILGIKCLYDRAIKEDCCLAQIIEIAVDWYETQNINYYSFFNKVFLTIEGPTIYYHSLRNFLVNVILDDSYYDICWVKYDSKNGNMVAGEAWKDQPCVIWGNDDNGKSDPKEMLDAMLFHIKLDERRVAMEEEKLRLFDMLHATDEEVALSNEIISEVIAEEKV